MQGFFDTSVLVPVFYGDHVHHQASLARFSQFDKRTGCCGAHCALKGQAETIYSWNMRHYVQCGPKVVRRLRTP